MNQVPWDAKELSVGQVSERSGVAISALHFYERQNLIHSRRTSGNQRRYPRETLRRIAFIRIAQRVGVPLASIAEYLSQLPNDHAPSRADWKRVTRLYQNEIDERIHRLQQLRDEFTECIGCGCLSIGSCKLANPYDTLADHGPGPRRLLEN
ncbi:redox-sensitive transcriptional activator SoxR [Sciscionella marina]|uniref:redox-sensitive transcriptional activator SoxR n=1 Tax=Sciscionella marina TaxID=508770 RepID=UPI000382805A|nr:redox-sensitive transcriptional activator SoxR [Sciscionella marina]